MEAGDSPKRWDLVFLCRVHGIFTFSSLVLAVGFGLIFHLYPSQITKRQIMYINFLGSLYLRLLHVLTFSLLVSGFVASLCQFGHKQVGTVAVTAALTFVSSSLVIATWGMCVHVVRAALLPAPAKSDFTVVYTDERRLPVDTFLDVFRNMFPTNFIDVWFYSYITVYERPPNTGAEEISPDWNYNPLYRIQHINYLGVVTILTAIGVVAATLRPSVIHLVTFLETVYFIVTKIAFLAIWLFPLALFFLVLAKILATDGGLMKFLLQEGLLLLTLVVGLLCHIFIFLPIATFIGTRKAYPNIKNMKPAFRIAFFSGSSVATLPTTVACAEEGFDGINRAVTRFVMPMGIRCNMGGTALFAVISTLFIAEVNGMNIRGGQLVGIVIAATLGSMGTVGIPQGSLCTVLIGLSVMRIHHREIVYAAFVDVLLDRFITMLNVYSDVTSAKIVEYITAAKTETRLP